MRLVIPLFRETVNEDREIRAVMEAGLSSSTARSSPITPDGEEASQVQLRMLRDRRKMESQEEIRRIEMMGKVSSIRRFLRAGEIKVGAKCEASVERELLVTSLLMLCCQYTGGCSQEKPGLQTGRQPLPEALHGTFEQEAQILPPSLVPNHLHHLYHLFLCPYRV